ncbi:MAG: extracellular solute-binding protein [Lachnospiraceae bacterium]|nr:extracellular solute-binding protein [Lachnospiraceae bacterium]
MMKKRLMAMCLAVAMAAALAGCGGTTESSKEETKAAAEDTGAAVEEGEESGQEPVEIEVLSLTWGTNPEPGNFVEEKILEDINVKLTMTNFATGDDVKTSLNMRLTGNDAPDLFYATAEDIADYATKGYLLPLDDYMDKMPNVKAIQEKVGVIGQVDGVQYGAVKQPQIYQEGYWIRKDWLDAAGLPMPTTLEELISSVEQIMNSDPDGNGIDDTIGITGVKINAIMPILAAYGVSRPTDLIDQDGEVVSSLYDENYPDAIAYIKDLLDKGIIDKEIMALTSDLYKDKLAQGLPVVVYDSWTQFKKPELYAPIEENNPDAEWVRIFDLEGPGATTSGLYDPTSVGAIYCVPAQLEGDEEKLDAIWRLLDYVAADEGLRLVSYGLEGEHYTVEDGTIVATDRMATEADFTWVYQLLGRNEMEYLGVKFPYAKAEIESGVYDRTYIRLVNTLVEYPDWYQRVDAQRYMDEEVTKFMFGERPLEEYDAFLETLDSTYNYKEFVAGVNEYIQGTGVLDN